MYSLLGTGKTNPRGGPKARMHDQQTKTSSATKKVAERGGGVGRGALDIALWPRGSEFHHRKNETPFLSSGCWILKDVDWVSAIAKPTWNIIESSQAAPTQNKTVQNDAKQKNV